MLAQSNIVGLQIAKGLGLATENLNSFKLEFKANQFVTISATYFVEEPTVVTVLEPFTDVKQYALVEVANVDHS